MTVLTSVKSIRFRLMTAFLVMLLIVLLLVGAAIWQQFAMVRRAASHEAEHIAALLSSVFGRDGKSEVLGLQDYVVHVGRAYKQDVVVVDETKMGIADADPTELGTFYGYDPHNEVGNTIKDGQVRVFEEKNAFHPAGIMQIVVPLREKDGEPGGPIVGAVIFEYTGLYNAMMAVERTALIPILGIGTAATLLIFFFGLRLANGMALRLQGLETGVASVAAGNYQIRMPEEPKDEIGKLGGAVNKMSVDLDCARQALLRHQETLEARVIERTTELAEANKKSEYLAYYDSLTALPNRRMFGTLLERDIVQARRFKKELAVLFVDLDRFKNINDTLGHGAGDLLLKEIAQRIKGSLRESDTVARLGGDEFVILLPALGNEKDVAFVANNVLAAIFKPITLLGQEFRVTASMGVSFYPVDGEDEQTLMKRADVAMYLAKEEGRNNFKFYSAAMNSHSFERLALESSLRLALDKDEFILQYQPKLIISTNRITGVEALLRWQHPVLGIVQPIKFMAIAEETGLILSIGRWVLRTACLQNVAWQRDGLPPMCMAVNLSPRQFSDENLLRDIAAILEETGMTPELLELEITEGMLMHDVKKAMKTLTSLRDMGVMIAIDDFGTGYSSLSHLKRFPLSAIKVDRSFIRDLETNADDRGVTEAIIAMGRTLSLTVIAEGVETASQLAFLRQHACDEFQGYYFSEAISAAECAEILRSQTTEGDPAPNLPRKVA